MLNHFFNLLTSIIHKYNGEVTKFIGDCVMAYFDSTSEGANNAVTAGKEILDELELLRNRYSKHPELNTPIENTLRILFGGVGISSGNVIEGNLGSGLKFDYTIIGDSVNVAARLQDYSRETPYHMVFDDEIRSKVTMYDDSVIKALGNVSFKGKTKDKKVFALDLGACRKKETDLKSHINKLLGLPTPPKVELKSVTSASPDNVAGSPVNEKLIALVSQRDVDNKEIRASMTELEKENKKLRGRIEEYEAEILERSRRSEEQQLKDRILRLEGAMRQLSASQNKSSFFSCLGRSSSHVHPENTYEM
jgi:class 3 adenylate cyclase